MLYRLGKTICYVFVGFILSVASSAHAEDKPLQAFHRVSGIVLDSTTREELIGASVLIEPLGIGRRTDRNGVFEFKGIRSGSYALHIRLVGYNDRHLELRLEQDAHVTILLSSRPVSGADVTVIAQSEVGKSPAHIRHLSAEEIEETRGQTLGETLEHISGVTTLRTGASIAKPVIRGLHSQRITVLNAGITQEGQQWGAEHGPEIDPFSPTQIDIVKGAASVEYGAGAMGGVIRVVPRELPHEAIVRGNLALNGFSNNGQGAASVMLEGGLAGVEGLGGRVQMSTRMAGDSRTPDYVLGNTAFRELNGSAALGYDANGFGFEAFASHFGSEIGIFKGSHIGSVEDLERAIERGRPAVDYSFSYDITAPKQSVDHDLLSLGGHAFISPFGKLEAHYGLQHNNRAEFESQRDPSKPPRESMRLKLLTHSLDLKLQHEPVAGFMGAIGINGIRQGNTGSGYDVIIPNYRSHAAGIFLLENYDLSDLSFKAGVRYDQTWMDIYAMPAKRVEAASRDYASASGAIGAVYNLGKSWTIATNMATAWRPPSINELYSNGVHHGSAQYELGDTSLTSERSINMDLTLRLQTPSVALEVSGYVNSFDGFINLVPQDEAILTISGAYPVFKYQQSNARLIGGEITLNYQVTEELHVRTVASIVRGSNTDRDEPLFGMPADRGEFEFEYMLPEVFSTTIKSSSFGIGVLAVAKQSNVPEGDYAPPPSGYWLLNANLVAHLSFFGQPLDLYFECRNILDKRYRDYLSRYRYFADDPGRNFILRISLPFGEH